MSRISECSEKALFAHACALAILLVLGSSPAISGERVLYRFQGGGDGNAPHGALIADSAGNLYGTTANGGNGTGCEGTNGCGTVFELEPNGNDTILYSFKGGSDGALPMGSVTIDASGNFYGTTAEGGTSVNAGIVFRLAPNGTETVLYAFTGGSDGSNPNNNLIIDQNDSLYGTTGNGGNMMSQCEQYSGCGVVFGVDSSGNESVLYAFTGIPDGAGPSGGVISDGNGNLYGETGIGGTACNSYWTHGCGTVFKLAADGTESILYAFQGGSDGIQPEGGLSMDQSGNLYGTTVTGGGSNCGSGCGTVFKVTPGGKESVLYVFKNDRDGDAPEAGVIMDRTGNLYGTTFSGGRGTGCNSQGGGCGTAFEIATNGTKKTLASFKSNHGYYPVAPLLFSQGTLYGTASGGGKYNDGVVFRLTK